MGHKSMIALVRMLCSSVSEAATYSTGLSVLVAACTCHASEMWLPEALMRCCAQASDLSGEALLAIPHVLAEQ